MDKKDLIVFIKETIKNRFFIPSEEFKNNLKLEYDLILSRNDHDSRIWNYWCFESLPHNWEEDIEEVIEKAKELVSIYNGYSWHKDFFWHLTWKNIEIRWYQVIPFEHFLKGTVSDIRNNRANRKEFNYKLLISEELWINPSQIRNIYIKLLLEDKIDIEDFKLLCSSTDSDIDLYNLTTKWTELTTETNTNTLAD